MNPFGPLFPFELRRVTRRQRPVIARCVYVGVLLVLLGFLYMILFPDSHASVYDFLFRSTASPKDLAAFGFVFFVMFVYLQFLVGVVAVAASSSSILAEEKERQTLPFLLTTTLSDHEIVLGKLAARLAFTVMILLAGLPVLALMQVMGGVDPQLLAAGFVATAATLISAAGVGAAVSITATSVRQANQRATGLIVAYLMGGPYATMMLGRGATSFGNTVLANTLWGIVTLADLCDLFNSGNFFWVGSHVGKLLSASVPLDQALWPALWKYLIFHGLLATVTIGWATLRLRHVLGRQADRAAGKASRTALPFVRGKRPPVAESRPVYWRETATAVDRAARRWPIRWGKRLVFVVTLAPLAFHVGDMLINAPAFAIMQRELDMLVRVIGTMGLCVSLFLIATTAAGSLARERRQKTFDDLWLTRLRNREILGQKAWAAVHAARWIWVWVAIHWTAGLAFGSLSPWSITLLVPVYALYALVSVRLGILCAVYQSAQVRPVAASTLALVVWTAAPWVVPISVWLWFDPRSSIMESLAFWALGTSPPTVLGMLVFSSDEAVRFLREERLGFWFLIGLVAGFGLAMLAAALAWRQALARMCQQRAE